MTDNIELIQEKMYWFKIIVRGLIVEIIISIVYCLII